MIVQVLELMTNAKAHIKGMKGESKALIHLLYSFLKSFYDKYKQIPVFCVLTHVTTYKKSA